MLVMVKRHILKRNIIHQVKTCYSKLVLFICYISNGNMVGELSDMRMVSVYRTQKVYYDGILWNDLRFQKHYKNNYVLTG